MENLNRKEIRVAESVIKVGLNNAAESLSFFMKENISIDGFSFSVNKMDEKIDFTAKPGNNIHLLITEVIGELKGVCCLIFSEEEAAYLQAAAMPAEMRNDKAMMNEMADAIMLEVDNIISASVITKFSNILNNNIYGGVPQLKKFTLQQLNEFVENNYKDDLYIMRFKTSFVTNKIVFKPEFIWLFDNSFLKSIKRLAETEPDKVEMEA